VSDDAGDAQAAMPPDPTSPEAREYFATLTADVAARFSHDLESGRIPAEFKESARMLLDLNVQVIAGMSAMSITLGELKTLLSGEDLPGLAAYLSGRLGKDKSLGLAGFLMLLPGHEA
jgi:hypothetical protein